MDILSFLIVAGIVILVGAIIFAVWHFEKKRVGALVAAALECGLEPVERDPIEVDQLRRTLNTLQQGDNRSTQNVFVGSFEGQEMTAFEFSYQTTETDNDGKETTTTHHLHVFSTRLKGDVPELRISPESIFSKVAQAFGYDDIDFESAEFSKKFCVRSKDKQFAYAFCDPRMIEFLLTRPEINLEAEGDALSAVYDGKIKPETFADKLRDLARVRQLIPAHLGV